MKDITSVETLDIPSNVTVAVKARTITVEGPRGSLTKNTGHIQMDIQVVSWVGICAGRASGTRAWNVGSMAGEGDWTLRAFACCDDVVCRAWRPGRK